MAKRAQKRPTRPFGIVVVLVVLLLIGAWLAYGEWQYWKIVNDTKREQEIMLAVQHTYEASEPDVLAGTISSSDSVESAKTMKLPIVMYHYVEYVKDPNDTIRKSLSIQPHVFEKHLKDLADNRYTTYFMSEVPEVLNGKVPYASRSAVLTFDDGYEDFYTDAFPLLKKYRIKSTQYITYDFIGRKGFMNKKQIEELISSGLVEIGSHAVQHIHLAGLSEKQAKRQLFQSKEIFEEMFGIEIKTFAYPYGGFDENTVRLAKDAGYTSATSVIPGSYHRTEEMYVLKRLRAGMFGTNMTKVLEGLHK